MSRPTISLLSSLSAFIFLLNVLVIAAHAGNAVVDRPYASDRLTKTSALVDQENSTTASDVALMELKLTTTDADGQEIFTDDAISLPFRPGGTTGWDRYDASKLFPRGDTWAAMAFEGIKNGETVLKAQESRPHSDSVQIVNVKIVQNNMPAATYTINVKTWYSVPSNWSLRLRSEVLDTTFVVDEASDKITFEMGASTQKVSSSSRSSLEKSSPDTTHVQIAGEVGPAATTLPVEMASFSVNASDDEAILQWETASETNNSGFAVQHRRSGADLASSSWSKIGFMRGHGTTNQAQSYRFTTSSLDPGIHFFRLKQIDRDGTTHFTETVKLIRKPSGRVEFTTAPNPFVEQFTVTLTPRSTQDVTIGLVDMLGRVVKEMGPIDVAANVQTKMQVAGSRLSAGGYLLRVDGETFTETRRVVHMR